jgi:hypothetical protein
MRRREKLEADPSIPLRTTREFKMLGLRIPQRAEDRNARGD